MHNGAKLFISSEFGNAFELYSIKEILEDYENIDYPPGWFPIGTGYDGGRLVIAPSDGQKGYIYWLDSGADFDVPENFLKLTFEEWLDYFIVSQGSMFWEWLREY